MKEKRLLRLASRLDDVDPVHFDMHTWAKTIMPCKTAGCAIGYATTIKKFAEKGLTLVMNGSGDLYPEYKGEYGIEAVMKFFDIDVVAAEYLFLPTSYPRHEEVKITPEKVAERIRVFVDG